MLIKDECNVRRDGVLEIDHPHLIIRLSVDLLRIDVKGSFKEKVEEALGNAPILKNVFSLFVPLHVRLSDIDSTRIEGTDKVKITLRHHRDIILPLERMRQENLWTN